MGNGPFPVPRAELPQALNYYSCSWMFVVASRLPLDFPGPSTHSHPGFEFFVPSTPMPATVVGRRSFLAEPGLVYPIDPYVPHGTHSPMPGLCLTGIQMDERHLQGLAEAAGFRGQVEFASAEGVPVDAALDASVRWFVEEAGNPQAGSGFLQESLAAEIAVLLLRRLNRQMPEPERLRATRVRKDIRRAIDYLLNSGEDYSLHDVARVANLSPYHFIRVFRSETGRTPYEFLTDSRIDRARALLCDTNLTVTEICYASGFKSPSHFARVFRRVTGLSPTAYRRQQ